jgi:hypothetical protein
LQHELCIVLRFTEHIDFGSKIFCLWYRLSSKSII